jgi:hypothetical protein
MFFYTCPYCSEPIAPILIETHRTETYKNMLFCSPTCVQLYKEVEREQASAKPSTESGSSDQKS